MIDWLAKFPNIAAHPGQFLMFAYFVLVFWPLFFVWKWSNKL